MQDFISFLSEQKGVLVDEKMSILDILSTLQLIESDVENNGNIYNDKNGNNNNNNTSDNPNYNESSINKDRKNIDNSINNDKNEKSFLDNLYYNDCSPLKDGVDYTILHTEINYEDFKFFISKIILSTFWIFKTFKKSVGTNFSLSPDHTIFQLDDINMTNSIADTGELYKKIESVPRTPSKKSVNQMKADAEQVLASVSYLKKYIFDIIQDT